MRKRNILVAMGACVAALALLTPSAASADPLPPTNRLLAGVGSDTTENVMNDFANGRTNPAFPGIPTIASWNTLPLPPATITTKAGTANCTFTRPFGSSGGVNALITQRAAAVTDGNRPPCVDFARSSSGPSGAGTDLTWVPFAVDGLTYATRNDTLLPSTLTSAAAPAPSQLRSLYLCEVPNTRPLLPQLSSGTRSTFEAFIGVTRAETVARTAAPGTAIEAPLADGVIQRCISDTVPVPGDIAGSVPLTENQGNFLDDARQVAPYSIAQIRAQQSGAIPNVSGVVQARRINGIVPNLDDRTFPFRRLVYNVIPTQFASAADVDYGPVFSPGGSICAPAGQAVIRVNGFATIVPGDPLLLGTSSGCGDLATFRGATSGPTVRPATTTP